MLSRFTQLIRGLKGPKLNNQQDSQLFCEMSIEDEMTDILDAFRATKLPFDTFYYSERHHHYMLVTHVFESQAQVTAFEHELKSMFPVAEIEIRQDAEGRFYLHLNPRSINDEDFTKFISLYRGDLFRVPEYRFNNKSRSEVKLLLDSLKTTDAPMDALYYNFDTNAFYIVSHVFQSKDAAEHFADIFRGEFGAYCVSIVEDIPGRFFVHLNPSSIKKQVYQTFYKRRQISLFEEADAVSDAHFSNSLEQAKFILTSLRYTSLPMDCVLYDKRTDSFYLASHVFSDELKAQKYVQTFQSDFAKHAAKLIVDKQGRGFVFLNPVHIDKATFDHFIKTHAG